MGINLYDHQKKAIEKLKTGSVLCGGVGSGKSRTSLAYFFMKVCGGTIDPYSPPLFPRDLYIITTAKKRDSLEWDEECSRFLLSRDPDLSVKNIRVVIDSWNNINKYCNVCGAFFIFDEQRVVGSGKWVRSFYQITKKNRWILLSATPGDKWTDYIPLFVANGFYKNKTEFIREHVVYASYVDFPKIERWLNVQKLIRLRKQILVMMDFVRDTTMHHQRTFFDLTSKEKETYSIVSKKRWNPYEDEPIENASSYWYLLRKVSNSSAERIIEATKILRENPKVIVFYNFDYELDILRELCSQLEKPFAEWNGHKHMPIPKGQNWVYLVNYSAGAEGWNCIETDTILFYSANYSYRTMVQAAGRIDRLNTPFQDLYCYYLYSKTEVDNHLLRCYNEKRDFNDRKYLAA